MMTASDQRMQECLKEVRDMVSGVSFKGDDCHYREASVLLDQVIRIFDMPDSPILQERFGPSEQ